MLNNRFLYELALLDEFKNKNDYLIEYSIIDDDPLKIAFTIKVREYDQF